MDDASKLKVYNGALRECQERRLASLSESREARHLLDDAWGEGQGFVRRVLAAAEWRFARRTITMTADTGIEPDFGYSLAYLQQDDCVRTCKLCSDERQESPLLDYHKEAEVLYTDCEPIYWTYVSDDDEYGGDYAKWTPAFIDWAQLELAGMIVGRLTGSKVDRDVLLKLTEKRFRVAKNQDAFEDPTQFPPLGRFARARLGGSTGRWDRGFRNRLIG